MAKLLLDHKTFTRRAALLGAGKFGLFGLLIGRMAQLQLFDNEKYFDLAEGNRISVRFIPSQRGKIYSRNNTLLVDNIPNYRVNIIPRQTPDIKANLQKISELLNLTETDISKAMETILDQRGVAKVPIFEYLSWDDFSYIAQNLHLLPGTEVDIGSIRYYPYAENFSHLTGYIGAVTQKPEDENYDPDPLLKIPGIKMGKSGMEAILDKELRGQAGNLKLEVNSHGQAIRELQLEQPIIGSDVNLTIDSDIQNHAMDLLKDQSGAVVLIRVTDGAVFTLASSPGFDPNLFVDGISYKNWGLIQANEKNPMRNKAITGEYPPGSTFKMMTGLAALESGVITESTHVSCRGYYQLGNHRFHCWKPGGHGTMNIVSALKNSCDVFFYDISLRVGIDNIAKTCHKFGLGEISGIHLPYERNGLIPTTEWKKQTRDPIWYKGDTLNSSIGQGNVLTTPMQLAIMTARIAANAKKVKPHLVEKIAGTQQEKNTIFEKINVDPHNLQLIQRGMFEVVNGIGGTAGRSKLANPLYQMAGKTGTSQVRRISAEERRRGVTRNEQLAWNRRDHALFVGYAPYNDPVFAVAVVVEHGSSGSGTAAPIAKSVMDKALKLYPPTVITNNQEE